MGDRSLFMCFGPGGALIPVFSLPPIEGVGAPTRRCAWLAARRCPAAAGPWCTSVHPRLAARQRGIFAFRRLTVVGPGRLLVADEAARVRPGDEGCVPFTRRCRSRSPPTERLRKAPLVEWIGIGSA